MHVSDALQTDWLFDGLTSLEQIRHCAPNMGVNLFLGPTLMQLYYKWQQNSLNSLHQNLLITINC